MPSKWDETVCQEIFPVGYAQRPGFPMNSLLKKQIEVLARNIIRDWDFTIIISGGGEVRVGKSILAMQIGAYWTYLMAKLHKRDLPFNCQENIVYDGEKLIKTGNDLGTRYPNACLIYDEAGADLAGTKILRSRTQDVLDYLRECGQYNMLNILVIPEYFDLPKGIAVSRSIFLIDVDYNVDKEGYFQRGTLKFFSRRSKKNLYRLGKKELNYQIVPPDFKGRFENFHTVDETEYRRLKKEALKKRESKSNIKFMRQRDYLFFMLNERFNMSHQEIADTLVAGTKIALSRDGVTDAISKVKEPKREIEEEDEE